MQKQIIFPIACMFFTLLLLCATTICRLLAWYAYSNENYHKFKIFNGLSLIFVSIACFVSFGYLKHVGTSYLALISVWGFFAITLTLIFRIRKITGHYNLFGAWEETSMNQTLSTNLGASAVIYGILIIIAIFYMYVDMFGTYNASFPPPQVVKAT